MSTNVVDLAEVRRQIGEARQRVQIQQSLQRLSRMPVGSVADAAISAALDECDKKGIDTSKEGFIQDMETLRFLLVGVLEGTFGLETDNTLMISAVRMNLASLEAIELDGKG